MRVILDMDGIIVDLVTPWIERTHQCCPPAGRPLTVTDLLKTYTQIESESTCGRKNAPGGPHALEHLDHNLFRSLQPLPGAIEACQKLRRDHEVLIATASAKDPQTAAAKLAWVEEHLGWSRHDVAIIQKKEWLRADVFIDDAPKNLKAYRLAWPDARVATIAYPYNEPTNLGITFTRFPSWEDPATAWDDIVKWIGS